MVWTYEQLQFMVNERKEHNASYHDLHEGRRAVWWKNVSCKINIRFGTKYTEKQVKEKFQGLVCDYEVNIKTSLSFYLLSQLN